MRLPFLRSKVQDQLVLAWSGGVLAYVQARLERDGKSRIQRFGVERQGADSDEEFAKRLEDLDFKGCQAWAMLRPQQYQILQIDAPSVAPEELRTAARWQIRDMVDTHLDDLTLDVLRVGDDKVRNSGHLFVVTAANAVIREVLKIGEAMRCMIDVIDVQDMAQRNIQSALARREGTLERAHAALVLVDERQALLTISAHDELFYTRRIDTGADFMQAGWSSADPETQPDGAPAQEFGFEASGFGQAYGDGDRMQRFLIEVQRSLDLWGRTWPMLPLGSVSVFAGSRSAELAQWLGQSIGLPVSQIDVGALFQGFEGGSEDDRQLCWPLLGALMRAETRKL
jgi:MSHA biogenesis protein MshI